MKKFEHWLELQRRYLEMNPEMQAKEEDLTIGRTIAQEGKIEVEIAVSHSVLHDKIIQYIDSMGLTERNKKIMYLRFNINNEAEGKEMSLEEVGQIFHLTRERIRQIESKILEKIRQKFANKKT